MTTERGNTRRANRLSRSRSPYLLQHQYNPVDWHEWGEEAFARAVAEDKPIFLSIGYATCHWCHVMEHESFEDDEVAALLNEHFIAIKVDREERPDIDHVYMAVCQMLSPQCGWPLTVLMTPDRRPFYVATYLPRHGFGGRPGMMELVSAAAAYWRDRREELLENAGQIVAQLQLQNAAPSAGEIGRREIDAAWRDLHESYDHINGGFGRRPKFPAPHNLLFLLRHAAAFDTHPGREMVAETLRSMRRGGIYDQIGFGLHRYSTDERWFLPHFEKMLYDQAMLTLAAAESYRVTGAAEFARMARETITYVLRDLADRIGGFHSAEDADSEGEEGKFYVWRQEEIVEALGAADAAVWCRIHGITREGTYREEASGRLTGANIPYLSQPLAEVAAELGMTEGELEGRLESMRVVLYERRENRRRPGRDDKVLTDWNGLMIAALARAGGVLREPAWIAAADRAADFILETMRDSGGRLLHRWRAGEAGIEGFADDYAFVAWGMLELYRATLELRWLSAALEFASQLFELFHDEESGGLWFTPAGGEQLPVRTRTLHDGAIPSANAVAADVCLRLARLTGEPVWESRARGIGRACADLARRAPGACTHLLASLMPLESESIEVVIVGRVGGADTETLRTVVEESKHPFVNLLFKPADAGGDEIERIAPFTRSLSMQGGGATAYVCRNNTCGLPIKEPGELLSAIGK